MVRDDLVDWIAAQLSLDYVVTGPPVAEDRLPGAVVVYQGTKPPDTCGGPIVETYNVVLAARRVGSAVATKHADIATLDALMQSALIDADKRQGEWAHIEGRRIEQGDAYSVWELDVWQPEA